MDKTFNNLMDIVSRTKKIDEAEGKLNKPKRQVKIQTEPDFDEPKKELKPAKTSLFEGKNAINKYLSSTAEKSKSKSSKAKSTTKKTTKKSTKSTTSTKGKKTTTKKTTKKTSTKTLPNKKDKELLLDKKDADKIASQDIENKTVDTKTTNAKSIDTKGNKETSSEIKKAKAKDIADKFQLINKKTIVKPKKIAPNIDMNDPKMVELYNALKETLLAGGTDVSEYMNENVTAKNLSDLLKEKKAQNINDEITKEQQEYEKLFTGSFLGEEETNPNPSEGEISEGGLQEYFAKQQSENSNTTEQADSDNTTNESNDSTQDSDSIDNTQDTATTGYQRRNRFDVDLDEYNNRDRELDEKIADYYKRKQEKLDAYNKTQMEEEVEPEHREDDKDIERTYEDIFNGEVEKRSVVMGEENEEEEKEPEEVVEEKEPVTTDFQSLYASLNADNFDDYTDKFVTPVSELPHGETFVEPKEEIEKTTEEEVEENTHKNTTDDTLDDEDSKSSYKQTFSDDEIVESEMDKAGDDEVFEQSNDDIYDLSSEDNDLDDYIVSSNVPTESSTDDDEDNTMVINTNDLPEKKVNYLDEDIDEDKGERIIDGDAISKQEFYNEMARLQENLINQLKSGSEPKEVKDVENASTLDKALDIINHLTQNQTANEIKRDYKAEKVADELIENIEKDMKVENLVGSIDGTSNEDNSSADDSDSRDNDNDGTNNDINNDTNYGNNLENNHDESHDSNDEDKDYDSIFASVPKDDVEISRQPEGAPLSPAFGVSTKDGNVSLLNKDVALNQSDLEYIVNSEKPKNEKTEYFYMSEEDKEKKKEDESFVQKTDSVDGKEMGDINLNKDISKAITTSTEAIAEKDAVEVASKPDDMEVIYTIFGVQKKKVEKMGNEIKVLYVASECLPFAATGGLADVAGSLPKAINKIGGVDVRVIMPLYGKIKNEYGDKLEYIGNFTVHLSWRQEYCGLFKYTLDGVTYYFVDNERYFKRSSQYGFYDDGERFAYFCKAIVEGLPMLNFFPDIIHCNDWQSALVSTYIKTGNWSDFRYYKIKNIYTIHNVEYQGIYGMENLKDLFGIDSRFKNDLEYNGDINLTKAAIQFSDKFTTVSNSYCDNLKQPYCSRGLHHIIIRNEYKLSGIINGIDEDFYNPKTDNVIYKNYDINSLEDKVYNKKILQDELGLPVDAKTPMLAMNTRLVSHKGIDLLTKILEDVLQKDVQFVICGTGEQRYIDYFKYLENKYPTKVRALVDKYSNENARKAYAAADIYLMPSKIEPCGISQMIASRYGTIPIVREVGGLKDTITDFGCVGGGNGYTFANYNPNDLLSQINRALSDYRDDNEWKKKMRIVMSKDFSWTNSARKYIDLYKSLVD